MTFPPKTVPVVMRVSSNIQTQEDTLMKSKHYTEEQVIRILQEVLEAAPQQIRD